LQAQGAPESIFYHKKNRSGGRIQDEKEIHFDSLKVRLVKYWLDSKEITGFTIWWRGSIDGG
jgi:hypothetical protein